MQNNIVLIGMPTAGKSSVGRLLAKNLNKPFIDTDSIIEEKTGKKLQTIVDNDGYLKLREIEEGCILSLEATGSIISTGGSAIYSQKAITHLGNNGIIIYLQIDFESMNSRLTNANTRGLAKNQQQSLEEMYKERSKLYKKAADFVVSCDKLNTQEVSSYIEELLTL